MDDADPQRLHKRFLEWSRKIDGGMSSHHLNPRGSFKQFYRNIHSLRSSMEASVADGRSEMSYWLRQVVAGIHREEVITLTKFVHFQYHLVFDDHHPLTIIRQISLHKLKVDEGKLINAAHLVMVVDGLGSKEACQKAWLLKTGRIEYNEKDFQRMIGVIIDYWSPRVFQEVPLIELLVLAALFLF